MTATEEKEQLEQVLLEPFHYLCSQPGKEIRTKLVEAFDHWLQVDSTELDIIKRSIEMLHNASLL
jgi:geranylgeranyl diphosphate synthase type 3